MTVLVYTPSHVNPAALDELTVSEERRGLVDKLVAAVRDEIGRRSHQHHILVGPRGSGKTHTLSLVVDRIRKDPALAATVLPVVLAEEEVVRQPVDLLIRLLERLRQDLGQAEGEKPASAGEVAARLAGGLAQLRAEREHGRAIELAAGALDHAAATLGRLLLAVVENLDALIGLGGEAEQLWELRKSLQHGKGLLLLAAAPSLFGSVVDVEAPFHGFFRQHALGELLPTEMIALVAKRLDFELAQPGTDTQRQRRLLTLKASFDQQAPKLRGLIAYTGGLPRFGHLLFDLAVESDASQMAALMARFLDEQTPFFQSRLDPRMVPGAELEVLYTLARASGPLTTRQIAEAQRGGTVNATAVLLKRLRERELVRESRSEDSREVRFDVAEPLLRVWRRFRAGRSEQEQILSLAEFVAAMFAPVDLRAERARLPASSFSARLLDQAIAVHKDSRPVVSSSLAVDAPTGEELSRQAEEAFMHGSLPKACELMTAAVARLAESGPSEALAKAYSRLSHFSLGVGDLDGALAAADQGLAFAARLGFDLGRAECMRRRGDVLFRLGKNDDALAAYEQAEPILLKIGHDLARANCICGRGDVLFRLGRNDGALAAYDQAESLFLKVKDDLGLANCTHRRGEVLFQLGRNDDALAAYSQAESLYCKGGFDQGCANCLLTRGEVLFVLGRNDDALAALDQAEHLYQKVRDALGHANCLRGRVDILLQLGRIDDALTTLDQAESRYREVGDDVGRAGCIARRGGVFLVLGRNDDAIAAYNQAEPLFRKVGSALGRANCVAGKGRVLLARGEVEGGLSLLAAATVESKRVGHAYNTDLIGAWTVDGLAKAVPSLVPAKLREHLAQIAPALSAAADGPQTQNALLGMVRALLQHLGVEDALDLFPAIESALPAERSAFLRPARLAAEILAKRRPHELPDEPEEVRRTVREFLDWATAQRPTTP